MAVTQIWAVKTTPGLTLRYISRPEKSAGGALVLTNGCSEKWQVANLQMQAHRQQHGKDSGILMHHGFVSFAKDELTSDKAVEFAKEFMQGHFNGFQYFVSVHQDTEHVHFNFAINAVGLDGKKYNGCKQSLRDLREWTDEMCRSYGLSVIQGVQQRPELRENGTSIREKKKWDEKQKPPWKEIVKADIDQALQSAVSWEDFLKKMRGRGYYVKHGENVAHITFKKEGMDRACRGRKIGPEYTEQGIKDRIKFREFGFAATGRADIHFRRKYRKWTRAEKEVYRLQRQRPTISTAMALVIHLLASSKLQVIRQRSVAGPQRLSQYDRRIQELTELLQFIKKKNLQSRADVWKLLEDATAGLTTQEERGAAQDAGNEARKCRQILRTLDSLKAGELEGTAPAKEEQGRKEHDRSWS